MAKRPTVRDLLDACGKHQFAMLRVETLEEAEAAERAGVELLSVPPAMIMDRNFRDAAPTAFAFPGDNFYEIGDTADLLNWAFPLYKHWADGSIAPARCKPCGRWPITGFPSAVMSG